MIIAILYNTHTHNIIEKNFKSIQTAQRYTHKNTHMYIVYIEE